MTRVTCRRSPRPSPPGAKDGNTSRFAEDWGASSPGTVIETLYLTLSSLTWPAPREAGGQRPVAGDRPARRRDRADRARAVGSVRVLVASHHPVVREGLLAILETVEERLEPIGTARDSEQLFVKIEAHEPDVVILDVPLSDEGTKITRHIKEQFPGTRVLLFSATRWGVEVCHALAEGADGVVLKTAEAPELMQAIRDVASGRRLVGAPNEPLPLPPDALTNRETEVLQCVARGMTNPEIAFALSISVHTVRAHVEHILQKLHAPDRASAVAAGFLRGLIA